jgi:hypothetical protein
MLKRHSRGRWSPAKSTGGRKLRAFAFELDERVYCVGRAKNHRIILDQEDGVESTIEGGGKGKRVRGTAGSQMV